MNLQPPPPPASLPPPPAPSGRPPRVPPLLSGALPVVGHTVEFVRSTIGLLSRAQRELGDVAAIELVGKKMVAVFGPEANEAVFRAPDTQLNPSEAYKIMTPIFGKDDVVYDAPPEKMNEQLKMLLPALKDRPHAHLRRDRRRGGGSRASPAGATPGRSISSRTAGCSPTTPRAIACSAASSARG